MYLSNEALRLATFVLLSFSYVARAAPRSHSRALDFRALEVRDGGPPLPAPKDDDLPQGDGKDLLPWSDDDYTGEDYKNFPDYDENQDQTSTTQKRAIGPLPGGGLPSPKGDPMNPNQGGTKWLRSVGIDGVDIGKAFRDNKSEQKFVGLTGNYGKSNQLGIEGTKTPFPVPDPLPDGFRSWQADHIVDLGYFVTIAKQSVPDGIKEDDWQKATDAIIGDEDDELPSDDSVEIAQRLNIMYNLRGITWQFNQCKNSIMAFAYSTQTTKTSYKAWDRSSVWGVYRYMRTSNAQFSEVEASTCAQIGALFKDQDTGLKIATYYHNEANRMYNKAIIELRRILAMPQAATDEASVFKTENCINDLNSPNQPPDGGIHPSAAAPAPSGTQLPAQFNPVCDKVDTYSLADTQAIYNQLKAVPAGADPNKNCWTDPDGGCNLLQASGGAQLMMCGPTSHPQQFASCANLAIAMNDFNIDCQTDYQVGGSVVIPYLEGVTLQLQAP